MKDALDVLKCAIAEVPRRHDGEEGMGPPRCEARHSLFKEVATLYIVWNAGFMDHRERILYCEGSERQKASLKGTVEPGEKKGKEDHAHLKEFVVYPSVACRSISYQCYCMHFVTVDAEEAFSMRDPAWRLLPVAQSQRARSKRTSKTAYCVPSLPFAGCASSVTSILSLVDGP